MVIARKKRAAGIGFKVLYLRANQTTAEAETADFIGHYVMCFHPRTWYALTVSNEG